MRNLEYILEAIYCEPWAITESRFQAIQKVVNAYMEKRAEIDVEKLGLKAPDPYRIHGKVAVVPVAGTIFPKTSNLMAACGAFSAETFRQSLGEISGMKDIETILLNVDSGGGMVRGGLETQAALTAAKQAKQIVAYSDGTVASQAYNFASFADRLFLSASAEAGSIGVFCAFLDESAAFENEGLRVNLFKGGDSKFKAMGFPGTALSEEHKQYLQTGVDRAYAEFVATVKANRPRVTEEALSGKMFRADEAIKQGLADGIVNNPDSLIEYLNR